jgi:phosphopantothenoylcysteine decarboxylase/phosphopantothenate--cysteine ligase
LADSCAGLLSGKKIILGVTGGIAAYKAAYIASALVKRGADVHVVMTEHALKLVQPATFWGITANDVITDLFEPPKKREIVHVALAESADLMLIAPATANIIGKLANGIADDMLTTVAMVARRIVICPAMNVHMYENPIVAANIDKLRGLGYAIVEPEAGRLACGDEGIGRLADPDGIVSFVEELLADRQKDYSGKRVLVTAGPTREAIDPVRYITNRSSGKMGYAIAAEAAARGACVTLVSGPTELDTPDGVELVPVETVKEMFDAVMAVVGEADLFVSAAAPADFRPEMQASKIKKSNHYTLELDKTEDILGAVGAAKGRTVLVGFAAETENLERNAAEKLNKKNADLFVANYVGTGSDVFGGDSNEVTLISRSGEKIAMPKMSKREVAKAILDYLLTAGLMPDNDNNTKGA